MGDERGGGLQGNGLKEATLSLDFDALCRVLDPAGSETTLWHKIIDREAHIVLLFQAEYESTKPRMSKCVRLVQEQLGDTSQVLKLTITFDDHELPAESVFGRNNLQSMDDLTELLKAVDSADLSKFEKSDAQASRSAVAEDPAAQKLKLLLGQPKTTAGSTANSHPQTMSGAVIPPASPAGLTGREGSNAAAVEEEEKDEEEEEEDDEVEEDEGQDEEDEDDEEEELEVTAVADSDTVEPPRKKLRGVYDPKVHKDFVLVSSEGDERTVKQDVLASCSRVFRSMLQSDGDKANRCDLTDVSTNNLDALLSLMKKIAPKIQSSGYQGYCRRPFGRTSSHIDQENMVDLLLLADKFQIEHLTAEVFDLMLTDNRNLKTLKSGKQINLLLNEGSRKLLRELIRTMLEDYHSSKGRPYKI